MGASDGFLDHLKDQLSGFGSVSARRMFGGAGLYSDGVMFGLVIDDTLYLKADEASKAHFAAEDMQPFGYAARGRRIVTSYWRMPERLLDDSDEMRLWARRACDVAKRVPATAKGANRRAAP